MADIVVTDAQGIPEKSYVSIRVGDVRRQMQYKPGSKFRFDAKEQPRHFILDVFEKVGTAQVSVADLSDAATGLTEGKVEVMRTNGATMNFNLKVTLPSGADAKPAPAALEAPPDAIKAIPESGTGTVDEVKETKKALRHQAAMKAKNYLDGHAVQKLLQGMVHNLLEKQPEDPLEFMSSYLQEKRVTLPPTNALVKSALAEDMQEAPLPDWSSQPGLGELGTPGFASDGSDSLPNLSKHSNITAKVLYENPHLYENLRDVRTPGGVSLAQCIKTGIDNRGHQMIRVMGIVAGDVDCYDVFRDVFEPMVNEWHGEYPPRAIHPTDLDLRKVTNSLIDPDGRYVKSVQVRVVRNLHGLRMLSACSRQDRREAERVLARALQGMQGVLKGTYYPLRGSFSYVPRPGGMSESEQRALREENLLFDEPDSAVLLASGIGRHWPDARGVFRGSGQDGLSIWINESDHAKIMVRRRDANLKEAFKSIANAHMQIQASVREAGFDYARSDHFGFLSTCPSQLGTGMTCSVQLKLPMLSGNRDFKNICQHFGLHAHVHVGDRGDGGELEMGVWEVSGVDRLGTSEVDQVNGVIEGCCSLIQLEQQLEAGGEVSLSDMLQEEQAALEPGWDEQEGYDEYDEDEAWGLGDQEYPGFPGDDCPDEMPDLSGHHSAMAEILKENPSVYHRLKGLKTSLGVSLAKCIKTGVDNQGHPMIKTIGMCAADAECFDVFSELFDPVIAMKHPDFQVSLDEHQTNMDYTQVTGDTIDPSGQRVLAVKVRMSRNIHGLRMPPACSKDERRQVESTVVDALSELSGELEGEYFPIKGSCSYFAKPEGMSYEEEERLRQQNLVFAEPDSEVQLSSGFGRHWPDARGVWLSENGKLVARINEEDHVRIVSMQTGQNLKEAFARICKAHAALQATMELNGYRFAHSQRLGYLGVCPTNIGSCMIVSVTAKLPLISAQPEFRDMCKHLHVVARTGAAVGVPKTEGLHDITNADRLGTSEVAQVDAVIFACRFLLELEERLENCEEINWQEALSRFGSRSSGRNAEKRGSANVHDWDAQAALLKDQAEVPRNINFSHIPGLGSEEYPGFPADICPADLPDLSRHFSLMADVLKGNPSIYQELKDVRTAMHVSLAKCIKTGVDNAGHPMIKTVGAVAGDTDSYETFRKLFDPVIKATHRGSRYFEDGHQTDLNSLKVSSAPIDPFGRHTISVRVRTQRNLRSLRMLPACSRDERREVERVLSKALQELPSELSGEYFPLRGSTSFSPKPWGMTMEDEKELEKAGLLFHEPDAALILSSGTGRDWPEARGVFRAKSQQFAAWLNEEDHLRLLVAQPGGDMKAAFTCLCSAENAIGKFIQKEKHDYAWSQRLGFLSACPSNLGTGLRAEVTCKLPLLSAQPGFKALCRRMKLQVRAASGDASSNIAGAMDIGNTERLGSSEVSQVNNVIDGARQLIDLELRLESGEEVDLTSVQIPLPS